jgi:hypothetical protein
MNTKKQKGDNRIMQPAGKILKGKRVSPEGRFHVKCGIDICFGRIRGIKIDVLKAFVNKYVVFKSKNSGLVGRDGPRDL